jgi:hypothetical protein
MRRLDPTTPFQICELGGTFARSSEVKAFLIRVARGDWPGVRRVNLFAGDLNPLAVSQHGHFGFVLPGDNVSYIASLVADGAGPAFAKEATAKNVRQLEELSSGWRSPDMTLAGRVVRTSPGTPYILLMADTVTDDLGEPAPISPPRAKHLIIVPGSAAAAATPARPGQRIEATGWDSGAGTPLRTRAITPS